MAVSLVEHLFHVLNNIHPVLAYVIRTPLLFYVPNALFASQTYDESGPTVFWSEEL
jgi:hypothetical protein